MRRVLFAVFGTIAGLVGLLSYKTHPSALASSSVSIGTTSTGSATSGSVPATPSPASTTGTSSNASTASASAISTRTVTGASVDTRYGPVQVKITVTNGTIISATAVDYPQGNGRDQQINAYALPILVQNTLSAQNANIDMVSGATVTSTGYLQSLQSALDQAGLT